MDLVWNNLLTCDYERTRPAGLAWNSTFTPRSPIS